MPVSILVSGEVKKLCGFCYHKCALCVEDIIEEVLHEDLEESIVGYCLILTYKIINQQLQFQFEFSIVFSNWDVIDEVGNKHLPGLCKTLFAENVLSL